MDESKVIEAMKQALKALEHSHATEPIWKTPIKNAITALRQALGCDHCNQPSFVGTECKNCGRVSEQPADKPVAWMSKEDYEDFLDETKITSSLVYNYEIDIPLYTTPLNPMDSIKSSKTLDAQPQQAEKQEPVNWKRLYELEKKKKEAIYEKYERDIAKLPRIIPMEATPQQAEKQEPVAWVDVHDYTNLYYRKPAQVDVVPLYYGPATPQPQREWVGLTDEEVVARANNEVFAEAFARGVLWATEKLKEKNT